MVADGVPVEVDCTPDHKERREAVKFLIERGCGRTLETVPGEVSHDAALLFSRASAAELLSIFERVRSAAADAPAINDDEEPDA